MIPEFPVLAARVGPQVDVFIEPLFSVLGKPVRPVDQARVSEIDELARVARTEKRMVNNHGSSALMKVRIRSDAFLIDRVSGFEAIKAVRFGNRMPIASRDQMRRTVA